MPNNDYWNPMVPELTVSNFAISLHFYSDILGFDIVNQRSNPDFVYLARDKVQIMLEAIHDEMWSTGELTKPFGRGINLQMEFENINPILACLKTANIALFRESKDSWYEVGNKLSGVREFLVQDPDGYLLRFSQYLGEKEK